MSNDFGESTTPTQLGPQPTDGLAVASLVFGILACMSFWILPVCAIFAAVGFFLGRIAQRRFEQNKGFSSKSSRGWAMAGVVLSVAGVFLSGALYTSCYCMMKKVAQEGQLQYSKEIKDLENDPDLRKQLDDLRKDLKALDEQKRDTEKQDDSQSDDAKDETKPGDE
jgi:Domain of unknown function (DUF4190)